MGHFRDNTKKLCWFFPIVPKISDHSVINAPKINAEENCKKVNALSRKLHFCENCYIWGKAIAGTAKTFPYRGSAYDVDYQNPKLCSI